MDRAYSAVWCEQSAGAFSCDSSSSLTWLSSQARSYNPTKLPLPGRVHPGSAIPSCFACPQGQKLPVWPDPKQHLWGTVGAGWLRSESQRIIKLGRDLDGHAVPSALPSSPQNHIPRCHFWTTLQHFQRQQLHHLPRQLLTIPDHCVRENFFEYLA